MYSASGEQQALWLLVPRTSVPVLDSHHNVLRKLRCMRCMGVWDVTWPCVAAVHTAVVHTCPDGRLCAMMPALPLLVQQLLVTLTLREGRQCVN